MPQEELNNLTEEMQRRYQAVINTQERHRVGILCLSNFDQKRKLLIYFKFIKSLDIFYLNKSILLQFYKLYFYIPFFLYLSFNINSIVNINI